MMIKHSRGQRYILLFSHSGNLNALCKCCWTDPCEQSCETTCFYCAFAVSASVSGIHSMHCLCFLKLKPRQIATVLCFLDTIFRQEKSFQFFIFDYFYTVSYQANIQSQRMHHLECSLPNWCSLWHSWIRCFGISVHNWTLCA